MPKILFLYDIYDVDHTGQQQIIDDNQYVDTIADVTQDCTRRFHIGEFNKYTFWSRYGGPYVVASSINDKLPNWDVQVVDYFTKIDNFHEYIEQFITDDTEYIGLSVTFLQNPLNPKYQLFNLWCDEHKDLMEWFERLKQIKPNIKIIIGGWIVDSYYKIYCKNKKDAPMPPALKKYIDYAFIGYAEDTIIDLLSGKEKDLNIVEREGVKFVIESKTAGHGARIIQNRMQKKYGIKHGEWLPLEVSKGCRFGCKFCFYDHSGTIIKKPEELREELIYNYENFGTQGYLLSDDTVNDSPAKIDMMHSVIKSLPFDIEWVAYTRPDMFYKYPEMYHKMLDMGCRGMFLGVETLTHEAGKIAGKGLHPDKIKEILNWLREVGKDEVFILASFIVGLVGETKETLMETGRWLRDQRCLNKAQYELLYISDPNDTFTNDFSSNHNKFDIKIDWHPEYHWTHRTMTLTQAKEVAVEWEKMLVDHPTTLFERHGMFNTNFWAYPRIRSLGYTHHQAVEYLTARDVPQHVYEKNADWIQDYHNQLKIHEMLHVAN